MKPYEQILDRIAPTLYKLITYEDYFDYFVKHNLLIDSYLASVMFYKKKISPIMSSLYLPKKSNYYYYHIMHFSTWFIDFRSLGNMTYKKSVLLATNDKVREVAYLIYLDELIVNMIINGFSAENEREIVEFNDGDINPTNTFIALVGKEMYETLRASIR